MQDSRTISRTYQGIQGNSSRPTLEEAQKAKPRRGNGAPSRCASHYQAILKLLRERAAQGQGIRGSELYARPDLYGRSPRNRISELRRDGHLIEGKPSGSADWFYKLIREASGANPSGDWYTRQTGKPRPGWQAKPFSPNRMAQDDCFRLTPPTFGKARP